MAKLWIFLSTSWKLEGVQATLNVIISFLSVVAIWTFSRFCWQLSTSEVAKNHNVPLPSLLSIITLGETVDILRLLKTKILSLRHPRILLQCFVVTVFSVAAILSGPIARFSTRRGHVMSLTAIDGLMATVNHSSIGSAMVKWNQTQQSLIEAGFPTDQLLDFLPDPSYDWLYRADQWNSTWSAKCDSILPASLNLVANGDLDGLALFDQIPAMQDAIPERFLNESVYRIDWKPCGFYNQPDNYKDTFVFVLSITDPWKDYFENVSESFSFSLAAFHLHNSPRPNATSDAYWGIRPVESATYTRLDCDLRRIRPTPESSHIAYTWTNDTTSILTAYTDYHRANLVQQSISDAPIQPPSGHDLFQFYQVYLITKDIQYRRHVTRSISVRLRTVELSTVFLTFALLITLLALLGTANYLLFFRRHHSQLKLVPDSKLDWMFQSMKEAGSPGMGDNLVEHMRPQGAVQYMMSMKELSYEYEDAMYGCFDPVSQTMGPLRVQLAMRRSPVEMARHAEAPKGAPTYGEMSGVDLSQGEYPHGHTIGVGYGLCGTR